MNIEKTVHIVAGSFILLSLALSQLHAIEWLWATAFVGANLLQSALTNFCPLATILKKTNMKQGSAFN
ncbi:MAG: DUF2892 domain-containing protein [Gammaproteobacteria bacterium]|nr:DUF2892 domain-containing protein [Gammaproteobacteria bacterium]